MKKDPPGPNKNSATYRADFHDYSKKGTYHVTIVTLNRVHYLGELDFDEQSNPYIRFTPFGKKVNDQLVLEIPKKYPQAEVWQIAIMPDHIHMIIRITEDLPPNRCLGNIINTFKTRCTQTLRDMIDNPPPSAFERRYNDQILMNDGTLENWKIYLRDNPKRLATKLRCPDLFRITRHANICGWICSMIGNPFLLCYPEKQAVIVHRADVKAGRFPQMKENWLKFARNGGVLVSAAVSDHEREVVNEAMKFGCKFIKIKAPELGQYYKPWGKAFYSCAEGSYLEISMQLHRTDRAICREDCLQMNKLAEKIVASIGESWRIRPEAPC